MFMWLMETCLRHLGVWMKLNAFATAQENSGARWLGGYSKTCSAFAGGYCYAMNGEMWSALCICIGFYSVYTLMSRRT